jgi:hypothetical protein
MKPIEQLWIMFFRNGMVRGGEWHAWGKTARRTRDECIFATIADGVGGMTTRRLYDRARNRGVVRCARATIWADLPSTKEAP